VWNVAQVSDIFVTLASSRASVLRRPCPSPPAGAFCSAITVAYQCAIGTIDFTVAIANIISDRAASASALVSYPKLTKGATANADYVETV
jgi:hypothetical protein